MSVGFYITFIGLLTRRYIKQTPQSELEYSMYYPPYISRLPSGRQRYESASCPLVQRGCNTRFSAFDIFLLIRAFETFETLEYGTRNILHYLKNSSLRGVFL
jgi:hypothetical protein